MKRILYGIYRSIVPLTIEVSIEADYFVISIEAVSRAGKLYLSHVLHSLTINLVLINCKLIDNLKETTI